MPDQTIRVRVLDQCLMQPRCQGAVCKLCKGARERRLARNLTCALPAAQTPQRLVSTEHSDQQAGGGKVEHRFGDEGAGQSRPFGGWASHQAAPGWQKRFDPQQNQYGNQQLVFRTQRAIHHIVQPGQKFPLHAEPVCGQCVLQRHRPHPRCLVGILLLQLRDTPSGCGRLAKSIRFSKKITSSA